jgi:hypothetical protein
VRSSGAQGRTRIKLAAMLTLLLPMGPDGAAAQQA